MKYGERYQRNRGALISKIIKNKEMARILAVV